MEYLKELKNDVSIPIMHFAEWNGSRYLRTRRRVWQIVWKWRQLHSELSRARQNHTAVQIVNADISRY